MKKTILISGAAILLATSVVFAQGMMGGMMDEKKQGSMMGEGMMGGMMMKSMMEKSIVATSDGGVVVLAGNTLTKYDKDLNAVKEVEIKMDMEGMQKKMMDMMQNCPMMKGMMDKADSSQGAADVKSSQEVPEKSEHESHHP